MYLDFKSYLRNPNLKGAGVSIQWTPDLIAEYKKCAADPIYFTRTYMKLINLDLGLIPFEPYEYQERIIRSVVDNRYTVVCTSRQAGKTSSYTAAVLWFAIFHPQKTIGILANKGDVAKEILGRIKLAYEHLPKWLQQGVVKWNEFSIHLENGSRVIAAATSSSSVRGYSFNMVIVDEAAWVEKFDEFFASVFPTTSSGKDTKVVLVSTPNGLNSFYKIFDDAQKKRNTYNPILVHWTEVPNRDEKWKDQTLAALGFDEEKFNAEYCCEFLGSSGSLIGGWKLKQLVYQNPLATHEGLYQFVTPQVDHFYVLAADVSHGKGLDYSAFHVIDVTTMPYIQACVYRNNKVTPTDFAEVINRISRFYNNAEIIIEVNDMGAVVGEMLLWEFDNEHVIHTEANGSQSKKISFGNVKADKGLRTSKTTKMLGCSLLKLLVEQNTLIINDERTILELCTFSKKNQGYEAEEGCHDDLVMALVVFSWLTNQTYFTDLVNSATLMGIRDKTSQEIADGLVSFGYSDHSGDPRVPDAVKENQGSLGGYGDGYRDSFGGTRFAWDNLDDIRGLLS